MKYHIISYIKAPIGESGECCKSEYDFSNACDFCGTGAELVSHLKVKGFSKISKDFFETLDGDFIISKRIYEVIRKIKPDFILRPVIDLKGNILEYYHLYTSIVLPRFEVQSTGYVIDGQCDKCKRNGYFNHAIISPDKPTIVSPLNLIYKEPTIGFYQNELLLKTWECIGLSNKVAFGNNIVGYARPWIIVSHELKEIFESEKIIGIEFEEVIIIK
ncbi:MAG: hypothetical protein Q8909_08195 [Bacteroidota bacterium]|nr:hypothetical protein [Bacteroidota bacterium]